MEKLTTLLKNEIETELNTLGDMDMGSEEQSKAVGDLTKLLDRAIELEKIEVDKQQKESNREIEYEKMENELRLKEQAQEFDRELKEKQRKDENIDRAVKNTLTGVSIIGGFGLTIWGTIKSIKFEETGTITTIMGRGFINRLLGKK
jgi:hypothetical protein